jgi:hypothetical protein
VEQNRGPRYESTHLIFDKGAKNIRWRNDSPFNKCCWVKWLSVCRKLELDPCFSLCTRINSKWIKDLNIRPETLKLVQERAVNTLEAIGNDFLSRTQLTQQLRERIDKRDYRKFKSFCTTKEMLLKLKRSLTEWELYIRQGTDNQNIWGAQKIKLSKNQ